MCFTLEVFGRFNKNPRLHRGTDCIEALRPLCLVHRILQDCAGFHQTTCVPRARKNARKYRADWEEACKKCCLVMNFRSAINLEKSVATVQRRGIRNYQYEQPLPDFKWKLVEGDTLILDKPCKKAVGSYAGRNYVAWYAESVNLPYGPYLFGRLPGLIMYLHDTHYNWVFTYNGIEKATKLRSCICTRIKISFKLLVKKHWPPARTRKRISWIWQSMNGKSKSMARSRRRIIHKALAICWNYNGNRLIINHVKLSHRLYGHFIILTK